tara:strand:+ start:164 stop:502 length:339 start_codon:yes stop_codon:yes gene_type:complete
MQNRNLIVIGNNLPSDFSDEKYLTKYYFSKINYNEKSIYFDLSIDSLIENQDIFKNYFDIVINVDDWEYVKTVLRLAKPLSRIFLAQEFTDSTIDIDFYNTIHSKNLLIKFI